MRFLCLSLIILSLSTCLNTSAKNSAKLNKELLISAQIESVLMDYYERKKLADEENSHYFVIALISSGKNEEAKEILKQLIKKYPQNENCCCYHQSDKENLMCLQVIWLNQQSHYSY